MARLTAVALFAVALAIASIEASPVRSSCPSVCFCRHITPTVKKADCRDIPEWDLKAIDAQVVRIIPPLHPVPSAPLFLSRLDMFPKIQMFSVTNRSIAEVTSGNSPTLQVLDLSHNKITRFNERTFSHMAVLRQLNLAGNPITLKKGITLLVSSSIRTLVLGYTGLTHIPNGSLSGIPNLTSLYLQGNPIELHENVPLVDRVSIQELDLSYCKLTKIPYHSLDNLVNLQRLYLKGNDLKTLYSEAVPLNLHHLDLSANRFRDVPIAALSALKNLTNLELAKNPVKCTCDVISFLDRLSEHNVIFEKMIVCAEPERYAKIAWKDIDERELCKDDVFSEDTEEDDSRSTAVSFERDDVSYETGGPIEEENHILSQHPPPLSLQRLLQNSSRYQNMEENSIQSDQPYANTSDEGTDHVNEATTVGTVLDKMDDNLIAPSAAPSTDSSEVEEKHAVNERPHGKEDVIVPVVPDGSANASTSTDEKEDTKQSAPRDRERLEDAEEQKADLLKAPNASLEVGPPVKFSEESAEDPDAETFMRNEETIAMGKMMPEEKADPPVLLASHSEGQPGMEKKDESSIESEGFHPVSTPGTAGESLQPDEQEPEDIGPSSADVPSISESVETVSVETNSLSAETTHSQENLSTSEPTQSRQETSEEGSDATVSSYSEPTHSAEETSEKGIAAVTSFHSESPHSGEETSESGIAATASSHSEPTQSEEETSESGTAAIASSHSEPTHSGEETSEKGIAAVASSHSEEEASESSKETASSEQPSAAPSVVLDAESKEAEATPTDQRHDVTTESAEDLQSTSDAVSTENHFNEQKSVENSQESVDASADSLDHSVEVVAGAHNETEPLKSLHIESPVSSENDKTQLQTTQETASPTPHHDKTGSSSPGLFDDIDAQMASIYPDTPSTTERPVRAVETTPLAPETTTEESSGGGSFFSNFFFTNSGKDKNQPSSVSEPDGFPSQTSHSPDLSVENNEARVSNDVVSEEGDVHTATMAYAMIGGVLILVIIAVACVSLRGRPDKKRKGSAPVRIRGDNASPGTEMKDMMNPLLEPIAEGQTANEFHDDPRRQPSINGHNGHNGNFPVVSPVLKENGKANGDAPKDPSADDVTHVVIEGPPPQNGVSSGPANGKPPRQNGTKVKVVASVIPPAVSHTPVYVKKGAGES